MNDRWIEPVLGRLLKWGVMIAGAVVSFGSILFLWQNGLATPHYQLFQGEAGSLRTVHGIVLRAVEFDSRGVIMFGLLVLIATPVARVIVSIGAFVLDCDLFYAGISLLVLSILIYSLMGTH